LPAAYLTGLLIGKKAAKNKIKEAVLDSGLYPSTKGSRIYAVLKGAVDSDLKVSFDEKILPSEERIKGLHIQKFKDLPQEFEKIKQKILGEKSG
jgi:large subunit ribosomal protein L18